MRVVKFEAENFGPHERLAVEFRPGLNVVVGRNGSGKSHLVDGLYAALTGDFPADGNQAANVRQTAPKGARCRVSAVLTHGGTELTVTRRIAPSAGRELLVNGQPLLKNGQPARTADEINEALWDALGVTKAVLTDYAFVRQWEAFGVLTATPASRLKVLNRLFGVDQVDRGYTALDSRLAGLSGVSVVPPERLQEAETRLAEAASRLMTDDRQLADLPASDWCDRVVADYAAFNTGTRERNRLQERLIALVEQHDRALNDRVRLAAEAAAAAAEHDAFVPVFDETINRARDDNARRRAWLDYDATARAYDAYLARRAVRRAEADRLRAELDAMPVVPAQGVEAARLALDTAKAEWAVSDRALRANQAAGGDHCPTCRSPITAEYRQWFEGVKAAFSEQAALVQAAEARLSDLQNRARSREAALQRSSSADLLANNGELAYDEPAPPPFPRPPLGDASDRRAVEIQNRMATLGARKGSLAVQRDARAAECDRLGAEASALGRQIDALPPLPPEVSQSDFELAVSARARRSALEAARADHQRELSAADADVRAYRRLVGEGRRRAAASSHLQQLKDVFKPGPGGLASQVVDFCLESLTDTLNARLDQFGSPFTVRADAQASFTALFPDGTRTPAGRLSGGQKMILALAFRLSVLSEYGGDLGFLCLDEPTVGMDDSNRAGLTRCLVEVGRWAAAGDSQLIIVTHDTHLAAAADNVVRL